MGRGEEGQKYIDDALKRAIELKDDSMKAEVLNCLGDSYLNRGDYSYARQQYQQSLKITGKSPLTDRVLRATLDWQRWMLSRDTHRLRLPC